MRLFLDANVLFTAAHNPRGKAALTIELGKKGHRTLATSLYASEEARRNLERKFPRALEDLNSLLRGIQLVEHRPQLRFPTSLAEKDRPIFQAALTCGATHLLTGDLRDFGPFMNRPEETFGIVIQTVADFLRSASSREPQSSPSSPRTERTNRPSKPRSSPQGTAGHPPLQRDAKDTGQFTPQRTWLELPGIDVFDPVSMDSDHREGNDVPAWFLDTDYHGMCFHVCQAYSPRTAAWGGHQALAPGQIQGRRVDAPVRDDQHFVRDGRARPDRGQGDRRPRQRADRRQVPLRSGEMIHSGTTHLVPRQSARPRSMLARRPPARECSRYGSLVVEPRWDAKA